MKENIQLITAIRRNNQFRKTNEFLGNFNQSTNLTLTASCIVEASFSVMAERMLVSTIQQKLTDDSLTRLSELEWEEVQNLIDNTSDNFKQNPLLLSICNFENFMIHIDFCEIIVHAKAILEFDGDTMYAFTKDFEHGVGVDVYKSEMVNDYRYTVDLW